MKTTYFFFAFIILATVSIAQDRELKGTVYAFNRYPLKNITVKAKKSKQEVLTDEQGRFTIKVAKKDQLIVDARTFERFSKEWEKMIRE